MNELLTAELVGEMVAALALLTGGRGYSEMGDVWAVQMLDERMIEIQLHDEGLCVVIASTPAGFQEWIEEWNEEGLNLMRAALVRGAAFLLA